MTAETRWFAIQCTVVGGYGFSFVASETVTVEFFPHSLLIRATDLTQNDVHFVEIVDFEISGPGNVATGGGFVGGGFGIDGALVGIGLASVFNALTTRSSIHTFIRLATNFGELTLHYDGMEPGALRIALSRLFVSIRRVNKSWIEARRDIIENQRESISDDTYARLLNRLAKPIANDTAATRLGRCPSCNTTLNLAAKCCPKCNAEFGAGSSWSVKPL